MKCVREVYGTSACLCRCVAYSMLRVLPHLFLRKLLVALCGLFVECFLRGLTVVFPYKRSHIGSSLVSLFVVQPVAARVENIREGCEI